jgi:hydrogenase expression/formation protein HypD
LQQTVEGRPRLVNCYSQAVPDGGNPAAKRILNEVFEIVDAPWRGIGTLPASGYGLRSEYAHRDARRIHADLADESRRRLGEMPAGCGCADVVLGRIYPTECALYGKSCLPRRPVGPCMVSDEGACRIWWAGGIRSPDDLRALHA